MASDDSAGRLTSDEISGLNVYATDGSKLGSVAQVYIDDVSDEPAWVTVKTGLFGTKESFIPLAGARREGADLHIPYDSERVKEAPRMDADQHLDPSQEGELYRHYGLTASGGRNAEGTGGRGDMDGRNAGMAGTGTAAAAGGMGTRSGRGDRKGMADDTTMAGQSRMDATDADLRGPSSEDTRAGMGDGYMTLSEEQLRVSTNTEEREIGRARLRKYIVTEHVTTTIPVSHEEVRLVREPISESDRGRGVGRIEEEELEVTLHEERPTVRKEAVAVERVRLETEKVTEQQEISADVRKEQVEYDPGRKDGKEMPGEGKGGKGRHS
ncbi:PRC and DUF2382 domain-containing protein [Streptomyces sp. XM4193]|uniref:PRC and DUF2382 domain-containing protein n=1 Tax=Streptomyces sp. XM4193 TaxID=2929782 RepID=UPI001FF70561|nr:PRC and DUF2382 domain-containing protein [Streptomyces sp. XM4193]MCK1795024.1 PRC and DUF2382 domain-containing protein [Streptomyces sp. XM4193]